MSKLLKACAAVAQSTSGGGGVGALDGLEEYLAERLRLIFVGSTTLAT
jgi:hypothetical protein